MTVSRPRPAGIIGGMTSIITSTVEGVKTDGGVSGFFSGLGKGLVGTVTKPVAGALDFASETAQTVRDIASLSSHRWSSSGTGTTNTLQKQNFLPEIRPK